MGVSRRGFLGSILALAAAPAIVRADSLMRIVPRETTILANELVSYSEVWQFNQLRPRIVEILGPTPSVESQLSRYFAERLDALMADAFKDHLLLGHPLDPMKIAKDFHA